MSNGSSATKWVVGCLAVGFVFLLICAGFVAWSISAGIRTTRQALQQAQQNMARVQRASSWSVPDGWTAPAGDAADDALLPLQVGDWERMFLTPETEIPVVNIQHETRYAVYAANGQNLDVYVSRLPDEEKESVFSQAQMTTSTLSDSDDGTTRSRFYQTWDQTGVGWLVWNGGWLFVVQPTDLDAPIADFMSAWFAEIDARRAPDESAGDTPVPENTDDVTPPDSATPLPPPPPQAQHSS